MRATAVINSVPTMQNHLQPGNRALRNGRVSLPNQVYLITTATRGRKPIFVNFAAACAAARCFDDPQLLHDTRMLAWVLMPDHVHWLLRLGKDDSLEAAVNRLKSAGARHANRALQHWGPLWMRAFHDHALRSEEDLRHSARYVIANPVRGGYAERVGDYPLWNAIWL